MRASASLAVEVGLSMNEIYDIRSIRQAPVTVTRRSIAGFDLQPIRDPRRRYAAKIRQDLFKLQGIDRPRRTRFSRKDLGNF